MKKLAIVIILLIIQIGCHSTERKANIDDVRNSSSVQTTVSLLTPGNTQVTIMPAAGSAWMEAYAKAITDVDPKPRHITLLDVDFDCIPELFLSHLGTSNSWIYHGFSFKSGKLFEVSIPEEFLPITLELYRNKKTNEMLWIANGMFRNGYGSYSYEWYKVDFSDFSDVKKDFFFGWNESASTKSNEKEVDFAYALIDEKQIHIEMSKQEIENAERRVFSDYVIIETLDMFSFVNDFINGDGDSLTEENINKDLFYTFLNLYEINSQSSSVDNLSYPQNLPVYSINNYNTYSHSQTAEEPISLVLEGYCRTNEDTQTNLKVNYIQISRLNNKAVQTKINKILKNSAFDRVTGETSEGLEYEVFSSACILDKMLSVSERSSFYRTGTVHPWQNMSAYVFNYVTGEEVMLSDIITVDDRLKAKMLSGKFKCDRSSHEECMELGTYDELFEAMLEDYNNLAGSWQSFYFTDDSLGFILGAPHAGGDYWTFEIPFSDAEELFKPGLSAILKHQDNLPVMYANNSEPKANLDENDEWKAYRSILSGNFTLINDDEFKTAMEYLYKLDSKNGKCDWKYILMDFNKDGRDELFIQLTPDCDSAILRYEDGNIECVYLDSVETICYKQPLKGGKLIETYIYNGTVTKTINECDSEFRVVNPKQYYSITIDDYEYFKYFRSELLNKHPIITKEGVYYFQDIGGKITELSKEDWERIQKDINEQIVSESEWKDCSELNVN